MTQLERGARISPTTPALAPGDDARTHGPRTQRTHKRTSLPCASPRERARGTRNQRRRRAQQSSLLFHRLGVPRSARITGGGRKGEVFCGARWAALLGRLPPGGRSSLGLFSALPRSLLYSLLLLLPLHPPLSPPLSVLPRTHSGGATSTCVSLCVYTCVCVCLRLCARLLVRACPEARGGAGSGAAPSSSSS